MNKIKKTISLLTVFAMLLSFMSISAFAEETVEPQEETPVEETTEETEPEAEEEEAIEPETDEEAEETEVPEEDATPEEEAEEAPEPIVVSTEVIVDYVDSFLITLDGEGTITAIEGLTEAAISLLSSFDTDEETPFDWTAQSIEDTIASIVDATELPVGEDGEEVSLTPDIIVTSNDEAALTIVADGLSTAFEVEVSTELLETEEVEEEVPCEDCVDGELCENCEENEDCDDEECDRPEFIQKRFDFAKELEITNGKMRLIEKLIATMDLEEGTVLSLEDLKELAAKSVKEIMSDAKANRKGHVDEDDDSEDETADDSEIEDAEDATEVNEPAPAPKPKNSGKGKSNNKKSNKGKGKKK